MISHRLVRVAAAAAALFCGGVAGAETVDFDRGGAPVSASILAQETAAVPAAEAPRKQKGAEPFVEREGVAYIWPEIVFARGADYAEFAYTMSQNRDQVRKMMLQEFGELLLPMAYANADVNELAKTILGAILTFDGMHAAHKDEAVQGLGVSFENGLRAELDRLFMSNMLSDSRRRVEFLSKHAYAYEGVKKNASDPALPIGAMKSVGFLIHGSYTLLGGNMIQVTVTLEKLTGGTSRSFIASEPISRIMPVLAKQLFDFFQANEYQEWVNPQQHLQWLPSSVTQPQATATEGKLYCRGQGARFPYARELLLASQGGNYLPGGIPPLKYGIYLVADKQRHDEQHYFFTDSSWDATGGPVRTSAGYGTIRASYWCVKGTPSEEVRFYESLYRLRRESTDAQVTRALECLLLKLDDFGGSDYFCGGAYPSAEKVVDFLSRKGYVIELPQ